MKIGIFGGSFNPPHNMHKNIALDLIKNGYVDKIIYVPTGNSYNKCGLIDFKDRYKMVSLMIKNSSNLFLSDIGNNEKYKYTYQTLDYFKSIYPNSEIYFICGTDNLKDFYNWKEYEYILKNYKLLVIKRNNDEENILLDMYKSYEDRIVFADVKLNNLSSTYIRGILKENNKEILKYMDKNVYLYIKNNLLYK